MFALFFATAFIPLSQRQVKSIGDGKAIGGGHAKDAEQLPTFT
jgi:hypothetical protein